MLSKRISVLFTAVVVLGLLLGPAPLGSVQAQEPIKIGGIMAITGPASPLGTPERDTLLMLGEVINQAGGINGQPLELIIYDTASDETETVMATKKLIEDDKVLAIIGPSQTGTTLAIVDTIEKAELPLISMAAGIQIVEPVKKWVFKTPQTDVLAVSKIIDYLTWQGIDKIAVIYVSNAFGESGRDQIVIQVPEAGIEVVAEESFGGEDTDMTAQLTRIKGSDAQAVICWGTNPGPAMVAKNMMQLGMDIPLLQSHGIANKKFIELAGEAAEGVIFPAGKLLVANDLPDTEPQKEVLLEYSGMFEAKYGRSADTFGGHAWDALLLLVQAIEQVGTDKAAIRDALENTTNFVGTGGVFNFSPEDHNGLTKDAFIMVQIQNGEWTLMEMPEAAPAGEVRVVVIGKSVHPYWANVEKGVNDAAAKLGVKAEFFVPQKEDVQVQLSTMEAYIAQGVNGIAIAPSDPVAAEATIKAAMDAGIPVITLDTDAPDSVRLAYVGTSNKSAGVVAGEEMLKLLPDGGKVGIGTGSLTALNSLERIEGFTEAVAGSAIEIVEPINNDKEDSATALELANSMLAANPDLAGAFGVYAYNGPAWAKAVKEQGLAGEVKIVCFDATTEHIEFVKEGVIDVLVAQREYFQGYKSVELLTLMAQKGIEDAMAEYGVPEDKVVDTGVDVVTLAGLADYAAMLDELGIPHEWTLE